MNKKIKLSKGDKKLIFLVLGVYLLVCFGLFSLMLMEEQARNIPIHFLVIGGIFFYLCYEIIYIHIGKPIFADYWERENKITFYQFLKDNLLIAIFGFMTFFIVYGIYLGIRKINIVINKIVVWFSLLPSKIIDFIIGHQGILLFIIIIIIIILFKYSIWRLFLKRKQIKI